MIFGLLRQIPLTTFTKGIRHLVRVHLQFQYLFFIKYILNDQFAMRL